MGPKKCIVPSCQNTNSNSNKIFINVPRNLDVQKKWMEVLKLPHTVGRNNVVCEDHFELKKDAANWMYYKTIGTRLFLKPGVIPHKYIESPPPSDLPSSLDESSRKRKLAALAKFGHQPKGHPMPSILTEGLQITNNEEVKEEYPEIAGENINEHCSYDDESCEDYKIKIEDLQNVHQFLSDSEYKNLPESPQELEEGEAPKIKIENSDFNEEDLDQNRFHEEKVFTVKSEYYDTSTTNGEENLLSNFKEEETYKNSVDDSYIDQFSEPTEFKCHLCDYEANLKSHLKKHINSVHLDSKQYKCDFCDYATDKNAHLKSHMNGVHLKLKRYKCKLCNYATNRRLYLKNHTKYVHAERNVNVTYLIVLPM